MKGMIFTGPSIPRIMDGSKTMTRRLIKPQPTDEFYDLDDDLVLVDEDGVYLEPDVFIDWYCPYKVGQEVYVKETWMPFSQDTIRYKATDTHRPETFGGRWRSPLFMPEWASRATIRITDIKVERLGDISQEDAEKEGGKRIYMKNVPDITPRGYFISIWREIHGKDAWEEDKEKWVWCYSFERIGEDNG